MKDIQCGLIGESTTTVTSDQTARHLGSGNVDVYATPAMIALIENAAVAAIDHLLEHGQASVGAEISIKHLAATPLNAHVRAQAEILEVDGRRITFTITAWDDHEKIGEGRHVRYIINEMDFLARITRKRDETS